MRFSFSAMLCASCWAATPVLAMPLPDCAGQPEISRAHVLRVEKNGALILDGGRTALLEGLRLPSADHAPAALAEEALGQLRSLATAGPLTLTSTPPKRDRYDRVRVQAFGETWLQLELLHRGLARVQIAPDRNECAPDFYEAEQSARAAKLGLWALPAYAIRKPDNLANDIGSFQIVKGLVRNVAVHDGMTELDFSPDRRRGLSVIIAQEDRKAFRDLDPPLGELASRHIRLRGMVEDGGDGRPQIALSNPWQIEFLDK
jgi:micrococcal nuclease